MPIVNTNSRATQPFRKVSGELLTTCAQTDDDDDADDVDSCERRGERAIERLRHTHREREAERSREKG